MANYLIVVPRGNAELFELLSVAFRGDTGFNVVIDRRGSELPLAETERREEELRAIAESQPGYQETTQRLRAYRDQLRSRGAPSPD